MKKQEAVNTFSDGLIMDLNPLSMPNTALTNCLNGTLLTYNGNENMLQNDMGNARVETAMLPTGYIPLGSTSFGGIIYIVSYNPLDGKYQIGSFPSPERNLSKDELENSDSTIELKNFCQKEWKDEEGSFGSTENIITNYYQKVNLLKKNIYPGDKYKIFSGEIHDKQNYISAWHKDNNKYNKYNPNYFPKYLKLDVISTQSNGKTINLTNDSVWTAPSGHPPYYIYDGTITKDSDGKLDLDEYRGLVGSNYDTYVSESSGMLGIVAKLEVPTSFSVGYDVIIKENQDLAGKNFNKVYNLYFYLNWANDNEVNDYKNRINPKFIYTKIQKIKVEETIEAEEKSVHKAEIKLRQANKTTVVDEGSDEGSDALLDRDYATIEMPEYYNDDNKFDIVDYLENLQNNFNPAVLRKNDGTDFYYVIKGPIIGQTYNKETKKDEFYLLEEIQDEKSQSVEYNVKDEITVNNNILDLTVTPVMPFGQLQFLEKQLSIDLSKINQGTLLNILNYQYYVDDDAVNMDFNIESYLTLGDHIKEVQLEFYTIKDVLSISNWTTEKKISESKGEQGKQNTIAVHKCILQETYEEEDISVKTLNEDPAGGHKLTPIVIPENPITNIANGQCNIKFNRKQSNTKIQGINTKWFEENKIYVVKINIKTKNSERNRVFYRLFFNSPIFNTAYNSGKDFKDLYLIDSKVSYGLTPTIELDTLPKPDIVPIEKEDDKILDTQSNLKKFYETPQADAGNSIIHKYKVKNEFNSSYKIVSELGNEITLIKSESSNNVEASSSTPIKSDDKIIIIPNPKQLEPSIKDEKLKYSDEFTVEIPYTIIYNDIVSLKNYKLDKLSDASESIHAVIQHYSNESAQGAMELFIMPASNVSQTYTMDDRREEFYCPDENKNITFTMDNMALSIFDEIEEYDYCTLYFGIYWMKDNDCGYGYKTLTGANKPNFFIKLKKKPAICFMKINCVKASDGSIRFIFKQNETLRIPQGKDATDDNYGNRFSNYDTIARSANDASLIKNNYYKYKDSGTVSTLYHISNIIEFPEDPFITSTYTFNFKDLKFVVKIGDTIIRPDEQKYNVANNLKQNNNSTLGISTNVTNKIYNTKWVKNALSFDNSWIGLCEQKQISQSDLTKVFDYTGDNVVTALTIDKQGRVVLSEDYINNSCNPTRWYFGWEHTKPETDTLPTTSSEQGITSSSQYYKLQYLYSCKPFETVPKSSLETGFISGGNNSGFKDSEETGATGGNNSGVTEGNNSGLISGGNNSGATGGNNSGFKDFEEIEAT